jgi:BRCT domain type II-containing protein
LAGKTVVISGKFKHHSRDEYSVLIEQNGGKKTGSISAKTSMVLAGEDMGPAKLEKAQKLGIRIVSEEEFLEMIQPMEEDTETDTPKEETPVETEEKAVTAEEKPEVEESPKEETAEETPNGEIGKVVAPKEAKAAPKRRKKSTPEDDGSLFLFGDDEL